jgi:hypothetical protein
MLVREIGFSLALIIFIVAGKYLSEITRDYVREKTEEKS